MQPRTGSQSSPGVLTLVAQVEVRIGAAELGPCRRLVGEIEFGSSCSGLRVLGGLGGLGGLGLSVEDFGSPSSSEGRLGS